MFPHIRCRFTVRIIIIVTLVIVAVLNVVFLIVLLHSRNSDSPSPRRFINTHKFKPRQPSQFVPISSLLDLDSVYIEKKIKHVYGLIEYCPKSADIPIPGTVVENFQWQNVVNGLRETYVFSAFYDPRTNPASIKIIGISSGYYNGLDKPTKHCQLWYKGSKVPEVVLAEYAIVPETHDRRFAASFHICYLDDNERIPTAVSLVREKCQQPNNILKIINEEHLNLSPTYNYTVCVTPFNFNYDNHHQLVEMIEANRIFGAQKFVFYKYTVGSHVSTFLESYKKDNLVEVIPWQVPVVVDPWPSDPKVEPEIHYFAQLASLNDCLYRNMFKSRFIVFTDMDEIIVPRHHENWSDMLTNVTNSWMKVMHADVVNMFPGAYLFQNSFFRLNWKNDDKYSKLSSIVDLNMNTLLKTSRENKVYTWYERSKYIVWSRMISMIAVHSVIDFIDDSKVMHVQVGKTQSLLHHYRLWDDNPEEKIKKVKDTRMHHFAKKLLPNVMKRHSLVKIYN